MANTKNFIAKNGVSTGDGYSMPDIRPSLLLDFANSKTLDPRITFTRGSTATYWDGHTTTKAEENLIPYSDFSSGWTDENSTTITLNNDTAPDGTTTAARLIGVNGEVKEYFYVQLPISNSGKLTGSVYLKEAGQRYAYIQLIAGTTSVRQSVLFDLNTGTQVDTATQGSPTGVSYSITSVGNNWYRCVVTMDQSSSSNGYLLIGMAQSASPAWTSAAVAPVTGTTSDSILIWGPQLEERDSATAYTATTSNPIVKYQPTLQTAASGEARFDHDPVTGESKGLLIEESRTNLFPKSAEDTNFTYTNEVTFTDDFAIAPDGTQNAFLAQASTTSAQHYFGIPQANGSSSGNDTFSIHLKSYGVPNVTLILANQSGSYSLVVDLDAGTITTSGSSNLGESMEDVGNGWYRISMSWPASKNNPYPTIRLLDSSNASTWAGDGFSGVLVWGAQWEAGAFPTSYIPTSGSTVTRSLDGAEITGTSFDFFNNQESSLYAEVDMTYSGGGSKGILSVNGDISGTSGRLLNMYLSQSLQFYFDNYSFGNVTVSGNGGPTPPTKVALGFSTTEYIVAVDGSQISNLTGSYYMDQATSLKIGGAYNSNSYPLNGHLKKIACYPQQLTSATLQAMTEE